MIVFTGTMLLLELIHLCGSVESSAHEDELGGRTKRANTGGICVVNATVS